MKREALFGGTFDPIHRGHLFIAERALAQCDLDEVVFLPCRQSPHKRDVETTSGEDRLTMVRLAIADVSGIWASDWELQREGASYSWQTAEYWRSEVLAEEDKLYWVLGMDQWAALSRWARVEYLSELVTFIVFPRDGEVPEKFSGRNAVFLPDAMAISATEIRTRASLGQSIEEQVGDDVVVYIREKGLYRNA